MPRKGMKRRKRKRSKGDCQRLHAIRNLRVRYGLGEETYDEILGSVQSGHAHRIKKESCRLSHFLTHCRGVDVAFVYDKQRHTVVTALPRDTAVEYRRRVDKHEISYLRA